MEHITVLKLLSGVSCVTWILTAIVLLCAMHIKRRLAYRNLPMHNLDLDLLKQYFSGNIPKDVPFRVTVFKGFLSACQKFQEKGLCLVWADRPMLFIYSEEAIKFFSNEPSALNKSAEYEILKDGFGDGVGTSKVHKWQKHRKLLNPLFNPGVLRTKTSIANEHAADLVQKLAKESKVNSYLDPLPTFKRCIFNILFESIFETKPTSQDLERYMELINRLQPFLSDRLFQPWIKMNFTLYLFSKGRNYLKLFKEAWQLMDMQITKADKALKESTAGTTSCDDKANRRSIIQVLLDQQRKDPDFTSQDVKDNVQTLLVAGYDTTAYSLMWSVYLLGLHPEVQERAYDEVSYEAEENITYSTLSKLTYLDCIVKETLRIYPALPFYGRHLDKDVIFKNYIIPRGTDVMFNLYQLHRNTDIFPDPERFDPDRFAAENSEKINACNYVPFATGVRNCIGKRMALINLKIVLAHILRHFKITTLKKMEDAHLGWEVVLSSMKPLHIKFEPRL